MVSNIGVKSALNSFTGVEKGYGIKFTLNVFIRVKNESRADLTPLQGFKGMIIHLKTGKKINTESDLNAAERHIVQKLIIWKTIVASNHAFKEKIQAALAAGWNNSGPLKASPTLLTILSKFAKEVETRLKGG